MAVPGQVTLRAAPAQGQAPGLRPQPGVPFVLQCPVPEGRKKGPWAWEPDSSTPEGSRPT